LLKEFRSPVAHSLELALHIYLDDFRIPAQLEWFRLPPHTPGVFQQIAWWAEIEVIKQAVERIQEKVWEMRNLCPRDYYARQVEKQLQRDKGRAEQLDRGESLLSRLYWEKKGAEYDRGQTKKEKC
jgi:hypothetical protein